MSKSFRGRNSFSRYRRRGFYRRNNQPNFPRVNLSQDNCRDILPCNTQNNDNDGSIAVLSGVNPSPFIGWSLYFPLELYQSESQVTFRINCFKVYINLLNIDKDQIEMKLYFNLDYNELNNSELIRKNILNFESLFQDDPLHLINELSLALHSVIYDDCSASDLEKRQEGKEMYIQVRLVNFFPILNRCNLKADQLGKFVAIRGTVVRLGGVKPVCIRMNFRCVACNHEQIIVLPEGHRFAVPTKCINKMCRSRSFEPVKESPRTWIIDYQVIRLQESNNDNVNNGVKYSSNDSYSQKSTTSFSGLNDNSHNPETEEDDGNFNEGGGIPRTISCVLLRDLVDSCVPGDPVIVCGYVVAESASSDSGLPGGSGQCLFNLILHANNVIRMRDRQMDAEIFGDSEFSVKELYAIEAIHSEPDLFKLLVGSMCPNIYGHELVKASLLLALFGGVTKYDGDKNRVIIRGNCHVLVVGDPGLGKSQMLQFASAISPRSVYVCGSTTTSAGLTVTFCKDSSDSCSLEAGALLIADQGCCCIDEFDKMSLQHQASLLEAMEQQSISVAKAGIVCNLLARTSVLAAANPCTGHYDKSKTVSENLKLSSPLLSRFDLVFIMLDRPNELVDLKLSRHVLGLHSGKRKRPNSSGETSRLMNVKEFESITKDSSNSSLLDRISYSYDETIDPIPIPLLRKYIAYSRRYVNPKLSPEAASILQEFYLSLRRRRNAMDGTPITTRQLESLVRLTEARARVELREVATKQDALDVKELMLESMLGVYSDEYGMMNFSRSQSGHGMSKASLAKRFVAVLQTKAERAGSSMFSTNDLKQTAASINITSDVDVEQIISNLNQQGFILKRGPKLYKLLTAGF